MGNADKLVAQNRILQDALKGSQAQIKALQDHIKELTKPPAILKCKLRQISHDEAVKGFEVPGNYRYFGIDWRDLSVLVVIDNDGKT